MGKAKMIKVRKDIALMYIVDYKKSKKLWCGNPGPPELSKLDPGRATCVPGLAKFFSLILT